MMTCANGFLFVVKVLLSYDLPFQRLSVHRQTDRKTLVLDSPGSKEKTLYAHARNRDAIGYTSVYL